METLQYQFDDDGKIPNSVFPLIIYKKAFDAAEDLDTIMEEAFTGNNWSNAWRNGVYSHTITTAPVTRLWAYIKALPNCFWAGRRVKRSEWKQEM